MIQRRSSGVPFHRSDLRREVGHVRLDQGFSLGAGSRRAVGAIMARMIRVPQDARVKPRPFQASQPLDSGDVQHHPFDGEINHFVECILEGRESHAGIADAYRSHELCMAIDRSIAEGGRPVRLPLEGDG